jgi:hypothetical protein
MTGDRFRPRVVVVLDVLGIERRDGGELALVEGAHQGVEDRVCAV